MQRTNIHITDKDTLTDIKGFQFDNRLSGRERVKHILEGRANPYCFRYGGMGVKVEFTDNGPALEDLLAGLLLRMKSEP